MQRKFMEKRGLEPSSSEEGQPDKKRPALASVIVEALKVDSLQKLCSSLEPILRRVVSEEVERALAKLGPSKLNGRVSPKQIEGPDGGGRDLRLQFRSKMSLPLFTGGKVEGEKGAALHVLLIDAATGRLVTAGQESAARLDVVVLEGDFNSEGWTAEEFENHVVKERDGKRPLLAGDVTVALKEGVGTLGDLTFTDNSSWIRSRKFRLGVRVAAGGGRGVRVREAKTDAFTVKDHRGELYKKHYPPALNDEVWRLEKIGKDGSFHKKLHKSGIYNVEDFLRLVVRDPKKLRNILGSGMSNKMWEVLVEHAKTCILSHKLYVYYSDDVRSVGVVFNHIYELSGLVADGHYYSADSLSDTQKVFVDTLVKKAYDNWMHVVEYDGKSFFGAHHREEKPSSSPLVDSGPSQLDYPDSFGHQLGPPGPAAREQPATNHHGVVVGGYDDGLAARYSMDPQNTNLNAPIQFDTASFILHNPLANAATQQLPRTDHDHHHLSLGLTPPSTPGFLTGGGGGTLNLSSSFRGLNDFFPEEEEIRMRSHEMLENEDMQHLLRLFNGGGGGGPAAAGSGGGNDGFYPYSSYTPSNFGYDKRRSSSGKAVVGWLKLKAALRWGIFIRKQAAERRAQLVELDES